MDSFKDLPIQGRVGASDEEILQNVKFNLKMYEDHKEINYYKGCEMSRYESCDIVGGGQTAKFHCVYSGEADIIFFVKHAVPYLTEKDVDSANPLCLVLGDPTPLRQVSPHTGTMMDTYLDRLVELGFFNLSTNNVFIATQAHPSYISWFKDNGVLDHVVLYDLDYPWTEEIVEELAKHHQEQFVPVSCGVSSVTCALMLARSFGINTAYLCGVDLYYPDKTDGEFVEIDGKRYYTSAEMLVQAMWLEQTISNPDFKMVVSSESDGIGLIAVDNGNKNRRLYSGFEAR